MRLVIQRVISGKVSIYDEVVGEIGKGYVVLCGIKKGDTEEQIRKMAERLLNLRIMADEEMKMNKSIVEARGELLCVSQFTLYAQTQGRRPGFSDAEDPERAKDLFDLFVEELRKSGLKVETGQFGTYMSVEIINDGPVTILLEG